MVHCFLVISCVLRFCECVLGVNVLLLCSVVVAVKGLVLFINALLFCCFFSLSTILVCLLVFLSCFSSPFVCLLLLRRLDQVDDLFLKKSRGVYQDVVLLLDSLPSFAFLCYSELIRVSVFVCWFACLLLVSFISVPSHVSVAYYSFLYLSFLVVNRIPKLVSL